MPRKLKVPCKHTGCPNLVEPGKGYCSEHQRVHKHDRPYAAERGYGSRWIKARKKYLNHHPLCIRCLAEGKYVKATVVDHIVPHRGDPVLFWDEENWQALCKHHHDSKTMTEDKNRVFSYDDRW